MNTRILRNISRAAALIGSLALVSLADAHFVWINFVDGKVEFYLADTPSEAPVAVRFLRTLKAWSGDKKPIALTTEGQKMVGHVDGQDAVYSEADFGVIDLGAEGYGLSRIRQYSKGVHSLAEAKQTVGLLGEIKAWSEGGKLVVQALRDKKGGVCEVELYASNTKGDFKPVKTDAHGMIKFDMPKGQFRIAAHFDGKAGLVDGKKFDHDRVLTSLTVG